MDVGEVVRARVEGEVWGEEDHRDDSNGDGERGVANGHRVNGASEKEESEDGGAEGEAWKIICSMNGQGMGPLTWW